MSVQIEGQSPLQPGEFVLLTPQNAVVRGRFTQFDVHPPLPDSSPAGVPLHRATEVQITGVLAPAETIPRQPEDPTGLSEIAAQIRRSWGVDELDERTRNELLRVTRAHIEAAASTTAEASAAPSGPVDAVAFTLPPGTSLPTRAIQGDPVEVPVTRLARRYAITVRHISHDGALPETGDENALYLIYGRPTAYVWRLAPWHPLAPLRRRAYFPTSASAAAIGDLFGDGAMLTSESQRRSGQPYRPVGFADEGNYHALQPAFLLPEEACVHPNVLFAQPVLSPADVAPPAPPSTEAPDFSRISLPGGAWRQAVQPLFRPDSDEVPMLPQPADLGPADPPFEMPVWRYDSLNQLPSRAAECAALYVVHSERTVYVVRDNAYQPTNFSYDALALGRGAGFVLDLRARHGESASYRVLTRSDNDSAASRTLQFNGQALMVSRRLRAPADAPWLTAPIVGFPIVPPPQQPAVPSRTTEPTFPRVTYVSGLEALPRVGDINALYLIHGYTRAYVYRPAFSLQPYRPTNADAELLANDYPDGATVLHVSDPLNSFQLQYRGTNFAWIQAANDSFRFSSRYMIRAAEQITPLVGQAEPAVAAEFNINPHHAEAVNNYTRERLHEEAVGLYGQYSAPTRFAVPADPSFDRLVANSPAPAAAPEPPRPLFPPNGRRLQRLDG